MNPRWLIKSPAGKLIGFTEAPQRKLAWRRFCDKAGMCADYWWDKGFESVACYLTESPPTSEIGGDGGNPVVRINTRGSGLVGAAAGSPTDAIPVRVLREPGRKGVVRLHPLPADCNQELAQIIATAVYGAVKAATDSHLSDLGRHRRTNLAGSIRKRVVNQLVCVESERRIRDAVRQSLDSERR